MIPASALQRLGFLFLHSAHGVCSGKVNCELPKGAWIVADPYADEIGN